jgi:type II secretory pathway component PulC
MELNKKTILTGIVILSLLGLVSWLFPTYRKTLVENTTLSTKNSELTTSLKNAVTENSRLQKTINENWEYVKEPVLGPDGKALLDGKGNPIYKTRKTKATNIVILDEKAKQTITELQTTNKYLEEQLAVYKKLTVTKRGKGELLGGWGTKQTGALGMVLNISTNLRTGAMFYKQDITSFRLKDLTEFGAIGMIGIGF